MRENGKSGIFISPTLCGVIRGRARVCVVRSIGCVSNPDNCMAVSVCVSSLCGKIHLWLSWQCRH